MAFRQICLSAAVLSVCLASGQAAVAKHLSKEQEINKLEAEVTHLQQQVNGMRGVSQKHAKFVRRSHMDKSEKKHASSMLTKMVGGGVTISTTPFLGLRNGNLLYNVPVMNEDLLILQQRYRLEKALQKLGTSLKRRALIGISGGVEGDLVEQSGWKRKTNGDIDLGTAELDIGVYAGTWADAFLSIAYDSSSTASGSRVPSDTLYLKRGFVTIGNLEKSPFYFSIGQMFTPFGRYDSAMITTPLTQSMARTAARAAVLGFSEGSVFAQIYGYNSLSQDKGEWPTDEVGVNVGGKISGANQSLIWGLGATTNIADSEGSLANGAAGGGYTGFATTSSSYSLGHRVPAADAYIKYSLGDWDLIAEYITAVRRYNPADMYFERTSLGARPASLHTELGYQTFFFGTPATAAITYGQTWDAVAMNLPRRSVSVIYDVAAWRHAAIGLEVRHDINYKAGTAGGGATSSGVRSISPVCEGSSRNIVTARFGVYF